MNPNDITHRKLPMDFRRERFCLRSSLVVVSENMTREIVGLKNVAIDEAKAYAHPCKIIGNKASDRTYADDKYTAPYWGMPREDLIFGHECQSNVSSAD